MSLVVELSMQAAFAERQQLPLDFYKSNTMALHLQVSICFRQADSLILGDLLGYVLHDSTKDSDFSRQQSVSTGMFS
jgi:hypothetical protein